MKKLLNILLCLPVIGFGQEFKCFKSSDVVINHLLGTTISYIKDKKPTKQNFNFHLNIQESIINWDDKKFIKWGIKKKHEKEINSNIVMENYIKKRSQQKETIKTID